MSAKEFISIDDDILTEVPIDNVNDIIQRLTNKDSSDDDECNINESISDKEKLSIKSNGSSLDTVPELENFALLHWCCNVRKSAILNKILLSTHRDVAVLEWAGCAKEIHNVSHWLYRLQYLKDKSPRKRKGIR
ncbi:hypothetical protein AVEN_77782-1 [Araneus ventricosus]|uniref:Uncharacterized protein n=1 Tax=Araneus ventricosus TaxID=182803 RepID=A0A4Y2S501_ARAVE|nr:hypothetical protein AVEN_77782-1 [Araneus ventricosus]